MKKKLNKKNLFALILYIVSFIFFLVAIIYVIFWAVDSFNHRKEKKVYEDKVTITEVEGSENVEVIEQVEEIPKENPYWDYIKMNMIDANFDELAAINKDVQGWIQVNGTNINYPFVQGKNNEYYLTHSFNKSYNKAGWVFLDYRNKLENMEKNTIIYAHARADKTMFGSLKNILKSKWLNNPNNYIIKLSTAYENTLWQVFSIYVIPTTNDYIQIEFDSDTEYLNLLNTLIERSNYNFNTTVNETDRILTLSTCYNSDEKVVLHAKLIKREIKENTN